VIALGRFIGAVIATAVTVLLEWVVAILLAAGSEMAVADLLDPNYLVKYLPLIPQLLATHAPLITALATVWAVAHVTVSKLSVLRRSQIMLGTVFIIASVLTNFMEANSSLFTLYAAMLLVPWMLCLWAGRRLFDRVFAGVAFDKTQPPKQAKGTLENPTRK
jgi:hypothetical protein